MGIGMTEDTELSKQFVEYWLSEALPRLAVRVGRGEVPHALRHAG